MATPRRHRPVPSCPVFFAANGASAPAARGAGKGFPFRGFPRPVRSDIPRVLALGALCSPNFPGSRGESSCSSLRGIGGALSQRWHPSPLSCHQGQSFVTPLFVSRWRPQRRIPAVPDFSRPSHFGKFRVTLGLATVVSFGHRTSHDKLISVEQKRALCTVRGARDTAAVRAAQQRPLKHGRREKRAHRRTTRRRSSTRRKA